jgi:hypothetical protein
MKSKVFWDAKSKEIRLKKATMVSGVLILFCARPRQSLIVFLPVAR